MGTDKTRSAEAVSSIVQRGTWDGFERTERVQLWFNVGGDQALYPIVGDEIICPFGFEMVPPYERGGTDE